jgi:hypothetical protein
LPHPLLSVSNVWFCPAFLWRNKSTFVVFSMLHSHSLVWYDRCSKLQHRAYAHTGPCCTQPRNSSCWKEISSWDLPPVLYTRIGSVRWRCCCRPERFLIYFTIRQQKARTKASNVKERENRVGWTSYLTGTADPLCSRFAFHSLHHYIGSPCD